MPHPEAQLRRIHRHLADQDITLCRMGSQPEWIALGLPQSPSLRYSQGRWIATDKQLKALVNQAIGKQAHGQRKRRLPSHSNQAPNGGPTRIAN